MWYDTCFHKISLKQQKKLSILVLTILKFNDIEDVYQKGRI